MMSQQRTAGWNLEKPKGAVSVKCQCRTWDQENAIFADKTHLLNQQEGRERVGGSEA
jgi:hypothetical protein